MPGTGLIIFLIIIIIYNEPLSLSLNYWQFWPRLFLFSIKKVITKWDCARQCCCCCEMWEIGGGYWCYQGDWSGPGEAQVEQSQVAPGVVLELEENYSSLQSHQSFPSQSSIARTLGLTIQQSVSQSVSPINIWKQSSSEPLVRRCFNKVNYVRYMNE